MGMGKHDIGDNPGIKGHNRVFFLGLLAAPLEHTAIKQYAISFIGDQMHGTGYFPYGAVE
jgi:hypothetical protein